MTPVKFQKALSSLQNLKSNMAMWKLKPTGWNAAKEGNQICFCSDYCRERERYEPPFKLLAVFQWNPEIIKYMAKSY